MALKYFLYDLTYGGTVIDSSNTSFSPVNPYEEIYIDYLIPETQPYYLYANSGGTGGTIVVNSQENIDAYLNATELPPTAEGNVTYGEFTGTTTAIVSSIDTLTGTTLPAEYYNKTQINSYSANTLSNINTRVYRSGDTMTGTLSTSSNFFASGAVTGSSVCGGVWVHSPIICGETKVQAPIITGSTCVTASVSCATVRMQAPVVCGGTCVISPITIGSTCVTSPRIIGSISSVAPIVSGSTCVTSLITCATTRMQAPIVCATTIVQAPAICGNSYVNSPIISGVTSYAGSCLCSLGTTRLVGATTIGSTLNVGGSIFGAQSISGTSIYGSVSMLSPIVQSISCLCSQGTTRLVGAATAASTLNVSGVTKFNTGICWVNPTTGGTLNDYGVKWDPISKQLRTIPTTGSSANVYCYASSAVTANNATDVNTDYIARTWSLSAGYYEAEFNAIFGNTSANRCATVCFLINGSIVGSCNLMKTNDGTVQTTAYVTQNQNLSGGTHQVQIVYRAIGGGISQVHYGAMRVQKIGEIL